MTSEMGSNTVQDLSTLDGIRHVFAARQASGGIGYHALGERVLQEYWKQGHDRPKPVSAMTFRNFLQGKTTLRDPRGLELYFLVLGASDDEMRQIRHTLQHEVDRRVIAPVQQAALRAFQEDALEHMPYARAVVECEAIMQFEEAAAVPIMHVTPLHYLLGSEASQEPPADPRKWGLLHHLQALSREQSALDLRLQREAAELPEDDVQQHRVRLAADLREMVTFSAQWMLEHPRFAEFTLSQRRYVLHGHMPQEERHMAISLSRRLGKIMHGAMERFAEVLFFGRDDAKARIRSAEAQVSLEIVDERVFTLPEGFYVTTVQGSQGTGLLLRTAYQLRRPKWQAPLAGPPPWTEHHEALVRSFDATVDEVNQLIESDFNVPYGEVRDRYTEQFARARQHMFEVWKLDYAPRVVLEAALGLATAFHERQLLSDRDLTGFMQWFLTSPEGAAIRAAVHDPPKYREAFPKQEPTGTAPPAKDQESKRKR